MLSKFTRDLKAILDFGWLSPLEEWPEYDLLVAEPSIYYRNYVEKGLLGVVSDCAEYMPEFKDQLAVDGWILKTEEGLQDYLRVFDYLHGEDAYNKLMNTVNHNLLMRCVAGADEICGVWGQFPHLLS